MAYEVLIMIIKQNEMVSFVKNMLKIDDELQCGWDNTQKSQQ